MHFKMSSAICFNLDQFKILSSGNGLKEYECSFVHVCFIHPKVYGITPKLLFAIIDFQSYVGFKGKLVGICTLSIFFFFFLIIIII